MASLSDCCASVTPIPSISAADLPPADFQRNYFQCSRPVILTGVTDSWPARQWTIDGLVERVGQNKVFIRGQTHAEEYRVGKKYTIRQDTFAGYCADLLKGNARARSSYLAVASLAQAFPQLRDDVPLPEYLTRNGKLHLGPYLWVALEGHYEFCHFDPDDNFLAMIRGRKRVRLFGHDLRSLYPNKLGSHGKTVQSQVNVDRPDLELFPHFRQARCEEAVLQPGDLLFIPAFYWHQVSALDTGISLNMFYGDGDGPDGRACNYVEKILQQPYRPHFEYWLLNVIEQNRDCQPFPKIISRLPEVLEQFFHKQWHENASPKQISELVDVVKRHCVLDELPQRADEARFPPVLKIRGLLHRDGTK